jgi:hypothetical protein
VIEYTNEDIETDRLERLARFAEAPDFSPARHQTPSQYGTTSHVAYLTMETVERALLDDPTLVLDPEAFRLVHQAHTNLFNVFQSLGDKED